MAAEVLARELSLDLYRVDLSKVVNKYIGETGKRLDRIGTCRSLVVLTAATAEGLPAAWRRRFRFIVDFPRTHGAS